MWRGVLYRDTKEERRIQSSRHFQAARQAQQTIISLSLLADLITWLTAKQNVGRHGAERWNSWTHLSAWQKYQVWPQNIRHREIFSGKCPSFVYGGSPIASPCGNCRLLSVLVVFLAAGEAFSRVHCALFGFSQFTVSLPWPARRQCQNAFYASCNYLTNRNSDPTLRFALLWILCVRN